jgi:hypothetical protein
MECENVCDCGRGRPELGIVVYFPYAFIKADFGEIGFNHVS